MLQKEMKQADMDVIQLRKLAQDLIRDEMKTACAGAKNDLGLLPHKSDFPINPSRDILTASGSRCKGDILGLCMDKRLESCRFQYGVVFGVSQTKWIETLLNKFYLLDY